MTPKTLDRHIIDGPAGALEIAVNTQDDPRGIALIAHPNPLEGGTLDNKIVYTLAKTFFSFGFVAVRFNYRGVGASEGRWDDGVGEIDDAARTLEYARARFPQARTSPLALAGFSFGTYVQAQLAQRETPHIMVLIAPTPKRFALPQVPAHTLTIHGEHDEVIPLADALDWARPQHLPILVIPDCGHFFHRRLIQLNYLVSQHIAARLSVSSANS
ncbi:MAG: alpha/beta hydrolase [Burkholderiales bacterium]|jgi:alpha/beta superfamily hydrolase|nr:alpha/beta hydrolase [Burkholderiales bacterium]